MEHYTDGKERTDVDKIIELERVFGISAISPFGTNNKEVFEEKLSNMDLQDMVRLAEKVGVIRAADEAQQKIFLREAFTDWVRKNGDPIGEKVKGTRPTASARHGYDTIEKLLDRDNKLDSFEKIFPEVVTVDAFLDVIRGYQLTELRNLAARLGFNPSFDRTRLILLLKNEFATDLRKRSSVK